MESLVLRAGSLLALSAALGVAHATEYRQVELVDGRTVRGAVSSMTPHQLRLEVPQGHMSIELTQILKLDTIDEDQWREQPPWLVVVLPFVAADPALRDEAETTRASVMDTLSRMPGILVNRPDQLAGELEEADIDALSACGIDASCAIPFARAAGADVVLMGAFDHRTGGNEVLFASAFTQAPRAQRQVALPLPADSLLGEADIQSGLRVAFFLDPDPSPVPPPPAETETVEERAVSQGPRPVPVEAEDPDTLRKLAWIPVPGLPSLVRRDFTGLATSWAIAVPASAAMVGVSGAATTRRWEFAAVGLLSYCAVTVAINRAVGLRGLDEVQVAAAPVEGGGAALRLSVTR